MSLGGKVEGITSDALDRLGAEIRQGETDALNAIIEYYAAVNDAGRNTADQKLQSAHKKVRSARRKTGALTEIQAEHQAQKDDLANWLKDVVSRGAI